MRDAQVPLRPVHTYSIVARDPQTGEMGVAVQSHWFSVGQIVTWAEPGVGAVATQSFVDPAYGPLGLDLMRTGKSAPDALKGLLASDPGREVRQVAFVDAKGGIAGHTGAKCIQGAGNIVGENFAVQANLMLNDKVWGAMAEAFKNAKGDLAERMMQALEAAESVGGDARGKQSAAMLIVKGKASGKPWADRVVDLRVDDHAEPLKELRRLINVQRAYNLMNEGDLAVEHKDNEAALKLYSQAEEMATNSEGILPSRLTEMRYWHAVALVNMGRVDESLPIFKKVFAADENWRTLTPRLVKSELLPQDPKVLDRIMAQGKTK